MHTEQELNRDIMLSYHNVHGTTGGREVRIHEKTVFLARKRVVERCRKHTQQRFLRFLPLKHTQTREYLHIPPHIRTEAQLLGYVAEKKPSWLRQCPRRFR